jgi:hypothetical protein
LGQVDEQGRPVSDDGYYVWDGTQWVPRAQQAPTWKGPQDDGLDAEVESYGGMEKLWRPGLAAVRDHLLAGERVLASVGGTGDFSQSTGATVLKAIFLNGSSLRHGLMVIATDQRLLLATVDTNKKQLVGVEGSSYDEVERWQVRKRDVTVVVDGQVATAKIVQKGKLPGLREVVEPRLRPGVVVA